MIKQNNTFFINTLIILITGFIIKLLGLINRIFITRLLGPSGMGLYVLSFPTIMLFISISGLSLNITTSKLVSESIKNKKYSPKILLFKSIKLSLIISVFTIFVFLLIINPLVFNWLRNKDLYIPLLSTVFLIPLVGISDTLRGYLNGIKDMKKSSISTLLEQIFRILLSIGFLYVFLPYGIITATFFCLIALSIGEIASIIYCLVIFKKIGLIHYQNTKNEMNAIIKISIPSTLSRLIGNFTYFLEPILYVWILTKLNYSADKIQNSYTIVNAYTLSLLTLGSFVSTALSTSVVPLISENYAINNLSNVNYYIKKTLLYSLIPGIFITIFLILYSSEIMKLIYGTTFGSYEVCKFAIFFLPYYIQAPLASIYQALGKSKSIFFISSIFNFLRLLLIVILANINWINYDSLIIATFITLDLSCIIILYKIKKLTSLKVSYNNSITLVILFLFTFFITLLFKTLSINIFLNVLLVFIIYIFVILKFHIIELNNFRKSKF